MTNNGWRWWSLIWLLLFWGRLLVFYVLTLELLSKTFPHGCLSLTGYHVIIQNLILQRYFKAMLEILSVIKVELRSSFCLKWHNGSTFRWALRRPTAAIGGRHVQPGHETGKLLFVDRPPLSGNGNEHVIGEARSRHWTAPVAQVVDLE